MKRALFIPAVLLFILASCRPEEIPYPYPTRTSTATPVIPTATPSPMPTPTPTLIPYPVELEMDSLKCHDQTVYFGQKMVIKHDFQLGNKSDAVGFQKIGVEKVIIDGDTTTLNDKGLWSAIETRDRGKLGKFYALTFNWKMPPEEAGNHSIVVEFYIPAMYGEKNPFFSYCANLKVLPR